MPRDRWPGERRLSESRPASFFLTRITVEVGLRLRPSLLGDQPARPPCIQVGLLEVDSSVTARHSGLVGRFLERRPTEGHIVGGNRAGLELRASRRERDRRPETLAAGEEPQDFGTRGAEGAVPRGVLREGWRREGA